MKIKTNTSDIRWWFWLVTLVFIIAAVSGWSEGYFIVIGISLIQVVFFLVQEKGLMTLPVQVRFVYLAIALFGLWPEVQLYVYIVLAIGTVMITFFGRCTIALILKQMPWNKGHEMKLH